jgi:Tol biopolymer transport system component
MRKVSKLFTLCLLFSVCVLGCNYTPQGKPDHTAMVTEPFLDEDHDAGPCVFDNFDEFSFVTTSPNAVYYTSPDKLNIIDINAAINAGESYRADELTFDDNNDFFSIASSATGEIVLAQEKSGELQLLHANRNELLSLTDDRFPIALGITMSPDGRWIGLNQIHDDLPSNTPFTRLINLETKEQLVLEDEHFSYSLPIWSPNDSQVAFAIYDDHSSRIQIMDMDSREVIQVSAPESCHTNIAWSPDGHYLAASTSSDIDESATLIVIHVDSAEDTEIAKIDPSLYFVRNMTGWSPSGGYIMYESYGYLDPELNICIVSMDTGESSCPYITRDKLTVPFWMPGEDQIGLLRFELTDRDRFEGSSMIDYERIEFSHIEVVDLPFD